MSLAFATQVSLVMGFGQNFFEVLMEGEKLLGDHFFRSRWCFFFYIVFFQQNHQKQIPRQNFFRGSISANLWITL